MDLVLWAPVVGTGISLLAGAASVAGWWRAKGEREEAERQQEEARKQAKIATDAAAGASESLKQIAELQTQHARRQQATQSAAERDPWSLRPINGVEADLVNNTDTAKYRINFKIHVSGDVSGHPYADDDVEFVGPRRSARVSYIDLNGPIEAVITWHLLENGNDEQMSQTIKW